MSVFAFNAGSISYSPSWSVITPLGMVAKLIVVSGREAYVNHRTQTISVADGTSNETAYRKHIRLALQAITVTQGLVHEAKPCDGRRDRVSHEDTILLDAGQDPRNCERHDQ